MHFSSASFDTSVQCDPKLPEVAFSGYFASDQDLQSICTTQCLTSLERFRDQQKAACTQSDKITTGGLSYPATFGVDQLLFAYNYTCKRDPWVHLRLAWHQTLTIEADRLGLSVRLKSKAVAKTRSVQHAHWKLYTYS